MATVMAYAEAVVSSNQPRTFDEALKNVTGIFLITGYTIDMLVQSKSLIDAANRIGVNHIVHLGAFTRDQDSYATVFANTQSSVNISLMAARWRAGSFSPDVVKVADQQRRYAVGHEWCHRSNA